MAASASGVLSAPKMANCAGSMVDMAATVCDRTQALGVVVGQDQLDVGMGGQQVLGGRCADGDRWSAAHDTGDRGLRAEVPTVAMPSER